MLSSLVTQGTLEIQTRKLESVTQVHVCTYLEEKESLWGSGVGAQRESDRGYI